MDITLAKSDQAGPVPMADDTNEIAALQGRPGRSVRPRRLLNLLPTTVIA